MRSLSREQAAQWCEGRDIPLDNGRPSWANRDGCQPIPVDTGERIRLVLHQLQPFAGESEVLVWFTEWGAWSSQERPHIFERFRASYGVTRPLIEVPAHIFAPDEFEDLASFVTLGVLFLWDTNVIGGSGKRRLLYSHDEMVDLLGDVAV